MNVNDFHFDLPPGQIAQEPLARRADSRLMYVNRKTGDFHHHLFSELPSLLRTGDVLVVNDTQVIRARLLGKKQTGGKAELLLVRPLIPSHANTALGISSNGQVWVCLGQASKGLRGGTEIHFDSQLTAVVEESLGGGEVRVRLVESAGRTLGEVLAACGALPLPPYIERAPTAQDTDRYQTVYAQQAGSVAAPTAGLHFDRGLLDVIQKMGVERVSITLDVGPGTFLPVREDNLDKHQMHRERYFVPEHTAEAIRAAKRGGRRVVAVGTTVVRTLESATNTLGEIGAGEGWSSLFIRPGYEFKQVDALVTNFHLPKSTLLMLVSAFAGTEQVMRAYRAAVSEGYRFFSYGDAMFIANEATERCS